MRISMSKSTYAKLETNKRYATDIELKALTEIFNVSYEYLIQDKEKSRNFQIVGNYDFSF